MKSNKLASKSSTLVDIPRKNLFMCIIILFLYLSLTICNNEKFYSRHRYKQYIQNRAVSLGMNKEFTVLEYFVEEPVVSDRRVPDAVKMETFIALQHNYPSNATMWVWTMKDGSVKVIAVA